MILITLFGCASLRGLQQKVRMACDVESCDVIDSNHTKIASAPGLVSLKRQSQLTVTVLSGKSHRDVILEGRYRWFESLAANGTLALFFGTAGAALGVLVDWMSGAAWEYDSPGVQVLSQNPVNLPSPKVIAIAPPQGTSEMISNLVGRHLHQKMNQKYPTALVLDYDQTLPQFQRTNYTYDHVFDSETMLVNTLQKIPMTHFVDARIVESGNQLRVHMDLQDAYRARSVATTNFIWPAAEVQGVEQWRDSYWTAKAVEALPNSVGLSRTVRMSGGFGTDLVTPQGFYRFYSLEAVENSDLIAGQLGLIASNIRPYLEDQFQYVFRWTFTSQLYRTQYRILRSTTSEGGNSSIDELGLLGVYNLGLGLGPEIGVAGQFGYLYFNLVPSLGLTYADYSKEATNEWMTHSNLSMDFGYLWNVSGNVYFRMSVGVDVSRSTNIARMIERYAKTPVTGSFLSQTRSLVGLEYYLPETRHWVQRHTLNFF